jgi:hypothetical protein
MRPSSLDAKSRQWEPVQLDDWRAARPGPAVIGATPALVDGMAVVKEERMHGNKLKQILCNQATGGDHRADHRLVKRNCDAKARRRRGTQEQEQEQEL